MKRFLALFIILSLCLSGCGERIKEPVTFYYLKSDYHDEMSELLVSETREAAGHRNDLSYLMALYLMGPSEEELISPLPRGTSIFSVKLLDSKVDITLSDTSKTLTDAEFTLACACLTLTCLDLTNAESVSVHSGDRTQTMDRESILLLDSGSTNLMEGTQ